MTAARDEIVLSSDSAIDEVDLGLIQALLEDGRMSFTAMGQRVGLAGDAVRERYRRLVEAEIVRVAGVPDPTVLGYNIAAAVGIRVAGPVGPVAQALSASPGVSLVVTTIGSFDIMVELMARDELHLTSLIDEHLRSVPAVISCSTLLYLDVLKYRPALMAGDVGRLMAADTPAPIVTDEDRPLLLALQEDGRASYTDLADRLGMNYQQARRRTMALIASGAVRITTTVNRVAVGLGTMCSLFVRVDGRAFDDVVAALSDLPEAQVILEVLGDADLIVEAVTRDRSHLRSFITAVRHIDGVVECKAFFYASIQHLPIQWGADLPMPARSHR